MPKLVAVVTHAAILLAQMLAHVFAFEPGFHVAAGLVSAALVGTAMQACSLPGLVGGLRLGFAAAFACTATLLETRALLARRLVNLAWASPGVGKLGSWYRVSFKNGFDDPVHQQIGITANRAGEMGVSVERKPKCPLLNGVYMACCMERSNMV
jgi:hypothetical protein